jgi:hypothetical protein
MTGDKMKWAHCNRCNGNTQHDILHVLSLSAEDELDEQHSITFWDDYTLLKCRGCETVHLQHDHSFSEDIGEGGQPEVYTTIYPPRISRNKPEWFGSISGPFWAGNTEIEQILEEIYVALHNDSLRLAAMGIRALLEFIMIDKIGDRGSIGENITEFFKAGYIALVDQQTFRTKLIEAGHAAMHRGYKPSAADLGTLLDLTESLIASIYIHPVRAKDLDTRIPRRRGAKPKVGP